MKKYLYYPNLEPPDIEWLKFAILYLENFESIVPDGRRNLVSEDFRRLSIETDLVNMYTPEYYQGERASIRAIDEAERILNQPLRRSTLFHRINLARDWRQEQNWNYTIFSEKFSYQWGQFCIENNLGRLTENGIELPEELGFLFMTHLAKEIAYERNGSIITDNVKFDNYINFSRVQNPQIIGRNKFAKGIINLLVPADISQIGINRLIQFRNENRHRIRAFNRELDQIEESIGNGVTEKDFIHSFNDIYSELTREIVLMGIGLASIPFAAYMLIRNPQALTAEYTKEILGSLGIGLAGTFGVKRAFFDQRDGRLTKRYFTNLERLK